MFVLVCNMYAYLCICKYECKELARVLKALRVIGLKTQPPTLKPVNRWLAQNRLFNRTWSLTMNSISLSLSLLRRPPTPIPIPKFTEEIPWMFTTFLAILLLSN